MDDYHTRLPHLRVQCDDPHKVNGIITESYQQVSPALALKLFYAVHIPGPMYWRNVRCYEPPRGPEPERHLFNWGKNPNTEVSDEYLVHLANMYREEKKRLAWMPLYCTRGHWKTFCPQCHSQMQHCKGRFGQFFACQTEGCMQKTFKIYTNKWNKNTIAGSFCATPLEIIIGPAGNLYPGCPHCHPQESAHRVIRSLLGRNMP